MLAAEQPAHERLLRKHILRAPEPIGVPAPQKIAYGEEIVRALANRTVVDPLERVVAGVRGRVDEPGEGQVELVTRKHDPIEKIEFGFGTVLRHVGEALLRVFVANVLELYEALDRYDARREL